MILKNFLYTHIFHTLYKNIIDKGLKGRIPHQNGAKYSRKVFHLENTPVTNSMYWIFLIIILATTKKPLWAISQLRVPWSHLSHKEDKFSLRG